MVLIDAHQRHDWLIGAVEKRLREEFAKLQVEVNDEKSKIVDLSRGASFGFLGFDFRYIRGLSGKWRPHYTPKLKKRTALVRALKEVFRRHRSQPVERVIKLINPVLRGWVNYFAIGNSTECFGVIKNWVQQKVRRHLMQARKRRGFRLEAMEYALALRHSWPIQRLQSAPGRAESRPSRIGPISLGTKQMGARSAGNPHAACDVAGTGDAAWSRY